MSATQSPLIPANAGTQIQKRGTSALSRLKGLSPSIWVPAFAGMSGLWASPALAHPGHGAATLAAGLAHPFTGLDHMLAMTAVGLWAALRGGKALWAWPVAFVAAMLGGFVLGQIGVRHPLVEPAILASIIALGALVAANAQVSTGLGVAIIAFFGLAHGLAHGAEAPAGAGLAFPLGFAAATALLHLIGLGAGMGLKALDRPAIVRVLGLGAATGGLFLALVG
jgi:urease accessory protein